MKFIWSLYFTQFISRIYRQGTNLEAQTDLWSCKNGAPETDALLYRWGQRSV